MELRSLSINTHKLLGIRDLSAAIVFSKKGIKTKGGEQFYKLQSLAETICNKQIQGPIHSAQEDKVAIRKIYLKVENQWVDHISIPRQLK